jgi:outer membrane cobalamin receptor
LIRWKPQTNVAGLWSPTNIANAELYGYHLGIEITSSLQCTFDKNYSTDLSDELRRRLLYTPEYILTINYSKQIQNFNLVIHAKSISSRLRQYGATPLPKYTTIDVSVIRTYTIKGVKIKTNMNINNFTNKQFQSVYGYPEPGRQIILTFKVIG